MSTLAEPEDRPVLKGVAWGIAIICSVIIPFGPIAVAVLGVITAYRRSTWRAKAMLLTAGVVMVALEIYLLLYAGVRQSSYVGPEVRVQ